MYYDLYKELSERSFSEIKQDERLLLSFLKLYSICYLNGVAPNWCEKCQQEYFIQFKHDHRLNIINTKINHYMEVQNRTCKPAWNGLKYIRQTAQHWNDKTLTDSEAIYLLENNFILENQFIVLPEEWINRNKQIVNETIQIRPRKAGKNKSK